MSVTFWWLDQPIHFDERDLPDRENPQGLFKHLVESLYPVPNLPRENHVFHVQRSWNGVNVPRSLKGEYPLATGVFPWYGVYSGDNFT